MFRQLFHRRRALIAGKLPKSDEDRHATTDGARGEVPFCHPGDISLDILADPRRPNPVNRLGHHKKTIQHDNLLTKGNGVQGGQSKAQPLCALAQTEMATEPRH